MERIFISYKRANKDKVFPLVKKIEENLGVKCWVDLDGIESSAQFASKICRAIDNSEVVLFMHSSIHLSIDFETDWTIKELNYAQMKNKRVVLVKLDNSPLDNIFLMEFGSKHNTDSNDPHEFARLLKDINSWLNLSGEVPTTDDALNLVNLKLLTNLDCNVVIDGENRGLAVSGQVMKIQIPIGEYFVEFISKANPTVTISKEMVLMHDKIEIVDFLSLKQNQEFDNHDIVPYIFNNKVGFASKLTQVVIIPCIYEQVRPFSEGLAPIRLNGRWGYIDKFGKTVIPCVYESAFSFSEGLARVRLNEKYGYIDKQGKKIIPCIYKSAKSFREGLAPVRLNDGWGYIDKFGKEIIPSIYESAFRFSEGLACVKLNEKYGYVDKNGKDVISFKYKYALSFSENLACVSLDFNGYDGRFGFIDKFGNEILHSKYERADSFSEGLAPVRLNGRFGFIDKFGNEILHSKYECAYSFSEGLAPIRLNGRWGIINKSGKEIIPCKYDYIYPNGKGLLMVELNRKSGYIDIWGNELI